MGRRLLIVQEEMLKLIEALDKPDMERDEPIFWEKIHMAGSAGIGYGLALTRNVDPDLAGALCSIHDIGRIYTGIQEGHAKAGAPHARAFLNGLNESYGEPLFTDDEIEAIVFAVSVHSKKDVIHTPLCEICKDADILGLYYYGRMPSNEARQKRLDALLAEK